MPWNESFLKGGLRNIYMINILYFKSVRKVDMAEIVPLTVATV